MSNRIVALVGGEFLSWARESAGYSRSEIADKFDKSESDVLLWEEGTQPIYLGQLRKFANICKRPISDFYLPTPPRDRPYPHDFRRVGADRKSNYSPSLRFAIRSAREKQSAFLYMSDLIGSNLQEFELSASDSQSTETIGISIRKAIGLTFDEQVSFGSDYEAFNFYRQSLQSLNVLVFQFDKISEEEANGFSIYNSFCPLICVNRKMAIARRIFTLFHELSHIMLRSDSVCDLEDAGHQQQSESATEAFCNRVSACTLMPQNEFFELPVVRSNSSTAIWTDQDIRTVSRAFRVSQESVVRRLLTFDMVSKSFYASKRSQYKKLYLQQDEQRRRQNESRGGAIGMESSVDKTLRIHGSNYVRAVVDCLADKRITLANASELLDVRFEDVVMVEKKITQI